MVETITPLTASATVAAAYGIWAVILAGLAAGVMLRARAQQRRLKALQTGRA